MTTEQYLRAIKKLGLTKAGAATQEALGLKARQLQNIAAGDWPVPATLAKLLACLLSLQKRGIRPPC